MDERGNRTFGSGDGELSSAEARKIVSAGLRGYRPSPVVGLGDAAVLCFALAIGIALVWWATC